MCNCKRTPIYPHRKKKDKSKEEPKDEGEKE